MKNTNSKECLDARRELFMKLAGPKSGNMLSAYLAINESQMLNQPAERQGKKTKTK